IWSGRGNLSNAVLLDSGRAFLLAPSVEHGSFTVQTYDPTSKSTTHWDPGSPRPGAALAPLPGGRVAVMGGVDNGERQPKSTSTILAIIPLLALHPSVHT